MCKTIPNPVADAYRVYLQGANVDWEAILVGEQEEWKAKISSQSRH